MTIVREVGAVPAALDRLLQVERIVSLEPLQASADRSSDPSSAGADLSSTTPFATGAAAERATTATLLAALPIGRTIDARVVDVPAADHVVAEVGDLRIVLAWPPAMGAAPQAGQDVVLRVLAHDPVLLFESVDGDRPDAANDAGDVHWSSDALRLQALGSPASAPRPDTGAVRFDIPILGIEIELSAPAPDHTDDHDPASVLARQAADRTPAMGAPPIERSLDARAVPALAERARDIAPDAVAVAHATALAGVATPPIQHPQDAVSTALPFAPLLLQGPAWDGQPMELVVRRERDDDAFDNPALDHWCGEVTIDLPHLGRVAGHLSFSMQGLRVRIEGDDEHSVMTMSAASGELAAALAHADLRVAGLTVAGRSADTTRTDWGAGLDDVYGARHG